jgi:tRNA nucleotidyltransferase (CCA-adding enzyme)
MNNYLTHINKNILRVIKKIGEEADRQHIPAYIVGGFVRDIILKKKNLDLDIVVEGNGMRLAQDMAKPFKAKATIYEQFGTANLKLPSGLCVDFATARKEQYPRSGALPVVRKGTLKHDLYRRDFTINAMAVSINKNRFGQLVDEFGGLSDLLTGRVRILHERSFVDDPTRILRAIRFEQRFHFRIERRTLKLLKTTLHKRLEDHVKPPRYFAEFKKMLGETNPLGCLKRLNHWGGLRFLHPKLKVNFQIANKVHRNFERLLKGSAYSHQTNRWLIYFMALVERANKQVLDSILNKFHFKKDEKISIRQIQNVSEVIKNLSVAYLRPSKVYRILEQLNKDAIVYIRSRTSKKIVCGRIDRFWAKYNLIQLRINGEDLKRIGFFEDRRLGKVLEEINAFVQNKKN